MWNQLPTDRQHHHIHIIVLRVKEGGKKHGGKQKQHTYHTIETEQWKINKEEIFENLMAKENKIRIRMSN